MKLNVHQPLFYLLLGDIYSSGNI